MEATLRSRVAAVARVHDPAWAAVLLDPRSLRFLAPFIGQTQTASAAARELHVGLSTLLYRVRRFRALGLLEVVRVDPRPGRPIRHYRAVADAFFVPHELAPTDALEELWPRLTRPWQDGLERSILHALQQATRDWGIRIGRNAAGRLALDSAAAPDSQDSLLFLGPGAPALIATWRTDIRLDYAVAKEFQRELQALVDRYSGTQGAQRYILRLALAPIREGDQPFPPARPAAPPEAPQEPAAP